MVNKWSELQKGDKLYLMVPRYDEYDDIIEYKYQESYVISLKTVPDNLGVSLRFKYTVLETGNRRRCNMFISNNRDIVDTLSVTKYDFAMKPLKFGDILITYSHPDNLKSVLMDLIQNKQKEIIKSIDVQKAYIEKLEKLKNKF